MGISPQCWPIKNKTFVYFCRGIHRRPKKPRLRSQEFQSHNNYISHSYAFFHVENDSRAFFITIGRSRLNHLDSFLVDETGEFIRNGTPVYDYYTGFDCVYERIHFLEGLLKECLTEQNSTQRISTNPELMVLHFPETKAPTYHDVSIGNSTLSLNWVIWLLGLVILICCCLK
ncbi:uncharacterized protein LOC26526732 [Drosophila erecta]|uniref:uncharacterized protein LOC26526732 n=1 Tax=Drosophila erecta TaxID=7220 RepID=UPI0007326C04|nr:uncharacterized protein LOC26526732 [Drosophila erecta]KQS39245.1 uncharacterized protein Dere_GG26908 [Drosophila erecta]